MHLNLIMLLFCLGRVYANIKRALHSFEEIFNLANGSSELKSFGNAAIVNFLLELFAVHSKGLSTKINLLFFFIIKAEGLSEPKIKFVNK